MLSYPGRLDGTEWRLRHHCIKGQVKAGGSRMKTEIWEFGGTSAYVSYSGHLWTLFLKELFTLYVEREFLTSLELAKWARLGASDNGLSLPPPYPVLGLQACATMPGLLSSEP